VYAESNFVLEIALEQEQHRACEELLQLAANKAIELVLPAFALLEPNHTLVTRRIDGEELYRQLHAQTKQLERTASIAANVSRLREAVDLVVPRAAQDAARRFLEARQMLLDVARMIPLGSSELRNAATLAVEFGLKLPDAVMLASVLADAAMKPSPSMFLNRNTHDFNDPDVKRRLEQMSCDLVGGFDGGLARVRHALAKAETPRPPSGP